MLLVRLAEELDEKTSSFELGWVEVAVVAAVVVAAVFVVLLFVLTVASVLGTPGMDGLVKLLWIVGCLVAPVLVPTLWYVVGRPAAQRGAESTGA